MKEKLKTGLNRLVLLLLIGFMTHFSVEEVCASEFTNPLTFYKNNGAAVVYSNGYFYYGTKGATSSSSIRYRTVGFKFKVSNSGGNASVRFKTGGTGVERVGNALSGGYEYNLYRIQVRTLTDRLKATSASVHNGFTTSTNTIFVDSLMVVVINGVPQGTLANNGNTSSGTVYDTHAGIMGAKKWGHPPEKASYFDKPIVYRNILDVTNPSGYFTPNSASWTNGDVAPSFTPTDNTGGSGVDRWRYRKYTNGSWGAWTGWNWSGTSGFGTLAQGTHRFQAEVRDKAGNIGTVTSGYYYIDKTTPTATASPSTRGWGNTNVTVKLTYKDTGGSGLNLQQCKWETSTTRPTSWANYSNYPNGVSTGTAGTSYLHYRVSDKAGNIRYGYFGPYKIDKTAPTHQNHSLTGYDYKNGNDYWVKPNTQVSIKMRGYEALSGMRYNYIRLLGANADARSHHDWTKDANDNSQFYPSTRISIDSASRTYNSGNNKEITWKVTPKNYSDIYDIQYYYRDNASNIVGYNNTGMRLGVDNAAPNITITQNPTTWTNQNVDITAIAKDSQSGVKDLVLIDGPVDGGNLAVNTNSMAWKIYNKDVYQDAELTFREDGSTTIAKAKNTGTSNRMAVQQLDKDLYLKTGETYTLSFEVRGNINKLDYNHLMNEITPNQGIASIDLSNVKDSEWTRVSTTFTKGTGHSPKTSVMIGVREPKIGDWFEFKNVKVEKGSTATDWEPSNRDSLAGDGKNLVLKSNTPANSTEYRVTGYDMSTDWAAGETWTITIKGKVNSGQRFGVWANGSQTRQTYLTDMGGNIHTATFTVREPNPIGENAGTRKLNIYNYPNTTAKSSSIEWVKLEKGSKRSNWSPAPAHSLAPEDAEKSATHTITQNGTYTFLATDNVGYMSEKSIKVSNIDKIAPTIVYTPNEKNWTNKDVPVDIKVTDIGSGVEWIRYRIKLNNEWSGWFRIYSDKIDTINFSAGEIQIETEVSDKAGNITSKRSGIYQIDKFAPDIQASPLFFRDWDNTDVKIKLHFNDAGGSGISTRQYAWSKSTTTPTSWSNYSSNVSQASNGIWYLHAKATDVAGNVTTRRFGPYRIDKTAPTITASPSTRDWGNTNVTVALTYKDTGGSELKNKQYAWSKSTTTPTSWSNYSSNVSQASNGIWYLHAKATDVAGNVTTRRFGPYKIDKEDPIFNKNEDFKVEGVRYIEGENNYWIRANDTAKLRLKGTDTGSGIKQSYIRAHDGDQDIRSFHDWSIGKNHNDNFMAKSKLSFIAAEEVYNYGATKEVSFTAKSSNIDTDFDLQYYFRDYAGNEIGYGDTGKNLRIDVDAPTVTAIPERTIKPERGDWENKSSGVSVQLIYEDHRSGVKTRQYAWSKSKTEPASWNSYTRDLQLNKEGVWYLHYKTTDNVDNERIGYFGPYKIDKTAPTGIASKRFDGEILTVSTTNVVDNLSGVKRVWLTVSDGSKTVEKTLVKNAQDATKFSGQVNINEEFARSKTVTLKVYAEDIAGNIRQLKSDVFDTFTVNATVRRVLDGDRNEPYIPTFRNGEAGVLEIKTTGFVQELVVVFPDGLVDKDEGGVGVKEKTVILRKDKTDESVTYGKSDKDQYVFFIPLRAENIDLDGPDEAKKYIINITAIKNEMEQEDTAELLVSGNVLDQIRTRLR